MLKLFDVMVDKNSYEFNLAVAQIISFHIDLILQFKTGQNI